MLILVIGIFLIAGLIWKRHVRSKLSKGARTEEFELTEFGQPMLDTTAVTTV